MGADTLRDYYYIKNDNINKRINELFWTLEEDAVDEYCAEEAEEECDEDDFDDYEEYQECVDEAIEDCDPSYSGDWNTIDGLKYCGEMTQDKFDDVARGWSCWSWYRDPPEWFEDHPYRYDWESAMEKAATACAVVISDDVRGDDIKVELLGCARG